MSENPEKTIAATGGAETEAASESPSVPTTASSTATTTKPAAKRRPRAATKRGEKPAQSPAAAPLASAPAETRAATGNAAAKPRPTSPQAPTARATRVGPAPSVAANTRTRTTDDATTAPPAQAGFSRRLGDRHTLDSSALEEIDRMTNVALGQLSGGVSPASLAMAYLDWMVHLASSPGKQFQLAAKATRKAMRLGSYALTSAITGNAEPCIEPLRGDHRFDHPGWQRFPYNVIYQGFLLNQQWWHNATT
uniref:poly-beta-hydroxybutyrate polymerase N-terminal domain-containing protein n=1 Tax=Accumulibacter sp. TaxID=2053492 RepID=UPI0035B462EA